MGAQHAQRTLVRTVRSGRSGSRGPRPSLGTRMRIHVRHGSVPRRRSVRTEHDVAGPDEDYVEVSDTRRLAHPAHHDHESAWLDVYVHATRGRSNIGCERDPKRRTQGGDSTYPWARAWRDRCSVYANRAFALPLSSSSPCEWSFVVLGMGDAGEEVKVWAEEVRVWGIRNQSDRR